MSYLIIGKNGFIASKLTEYLRRSGEIVDVTSRSSDLGENEIFLDLSDIETVDAIKDEVLSKYKNIVFLAAISSPDECSANYESSYGVNVVGTGQLIARCLKLGVKVLFFSSDTVYGQTPEITDEEGIVAPIGEYGKMKNEIETLFEGDDNFKSMRMSYVVSSEDRFTSYLISCSQKQSEADVFHPLVRAPIWLGDVLEVVPRAFEKWDEIKTSVINLVGPEILSRVDMARIFKKLVKEMPDFKISEPDESFYVARPREIKLKSNYLEKILGHKPITFEDALKREIQTAQ